MISPLPPRTLLQMEMMGFLSGFIRIKTVVDEIDALFKLKIYLKYTKLSVQRMKERGYKTLVNRIIYSALFPSLYLNKHNIEDLDIVYILFLFIFLSIKH